MLVKKAEFINFRNLENESVNFTDGINVIYGENAQGKTNILEGIYIFARGKSFRALKDKEIIKFGADIGYSKIVFASGNNESSLGVEISKNAPKKFYRNKIKVSKTSEIIGEFRAVLFCPSHLGIIKDAPSVRRKFLDIAISQLHPVYIKLLNKYNTILENRNSVLKMDEKTRAEFGDMINVYSEELATLCADITEIRLDYIKKLDIWVNKFIEDMTDGKEKAKISYETALKEKELLLKETVREKYLVLLTSNIDKEIRNGSTLYGVHRDDLKIELNSKDAKLYSSQGQGRSLALAMKMAEGEISKEETGEYPVFLLDDVLSELDKQRKDFILKNIVGKQVIITSCEPEIFHKKFSVNYINIHNGKVVTEQELYNKEKISINVHKHRK